VHCHSTKAGVVGRVLARLHGRIPVLFTPHCFSFQGRREGSVGRRLLIAIERVLGKVTSRLITVSEDEYNDAINLRICPPSRTEMILIGVDCVDANDAMQHAPETRRSLGLAQEDAAICFLARLCAQKNPHLVVECVSHLVSRGINPFLFSVGPGPLSEEMRELAQSLGVQNNVRWLGYQPHDEAMRILAACDVMVLPSKYEGMPAAPLEAQAVGTVPIVTPVPGSRNAIIDGVTGLFVAPDDSLALADAVEKLIGDPVLRKTLSSAGREWVNENYATTKMVKSLERLYDELTAPAKPKISAHS
jgi:glycosyltransferase involved in cell wall biosynthesis